MNDADLRKVTDDLRKKSDKALAAFRADKNVTSVYAILADKEFERRVRVKQHELDLKLIAKQVTWTKFTAILGSAATLIGAIVGALLTMWLQQPQPQVQQGENNKQFESVPSKSPESNPSSN